MKRRVLGIDCGTAIVGWEILEASGNKFVHIDGGVIRTPKEIDMSLRLKQIYQDLMEIIIKYSPTEMAIEEIFYFKNNTTIISVSEARGVITLAGVMNNIPVCGYTPLEVKMAVTGYGRADKKQVQFMVKKLLHFKDDPQPDDWADAIAISICHLNSQR
jgi:crossover junction endodeoxyribonuclease RuvC